MKLNLINILQFNGYNSKDSKLKTKIKKETSKKYEDDNESIGSTDEEFAEEQNRLVLFHPNVSFLDLKLMT